MLIIRAQRQKVNRIALEMQALAMTLCHYEYILLHKTINVFSDNAVVAQLAKHRPINAREARLIAYLSQFKLNIRHVAGIRNCTADFLSRMCEDLDDKHIEQMRPSQNLINEEFILPLIETQSATPTVVTKGLHDSVESQRDKFQSTWAVYDVYFGPIQRKTITNTVNSEQSLTTLNLEAAEYQPQECICYDPVEDTVRALDDHPTSDLFIPRRSSRIHDRLINKRPNTQNTSNTDQGVKADASVQSDITTDDDGSTPRSTLPPTVNTNGVGSSTVQQKERGQRTTQNGRDEGDDKNAEIKTQQLRMTTKNRLRMRNSSNKTVQ